MRWFALLLSSFLSISHARVTFPNAEVLQAPDLAATNQASFKCKNACKVYVDRPSDTIVIAQKGVVLYTFNTIIGSNGLAPAGVVLPPGDDYSLVNQGAGIIEFVFYIVDSTAANYNSPVYAAQGSKGIASKVTYRYITVLSSNEAIEFSGFTGTYPTGYPKIYAAGYDSADTALCYPVYQARSQLNAEKSWPTIGTALLTVDFGFTGPHNVSINAVKFNDPMKSAGSTTVYTSPGYVGCKSNKGQNYHSPLAIDRVEEAFSFVADSLDVKGISNAVTIPETVHLNVNTDKLDMDGSGTIEKHYVSQTKMFSYAVALSWTRQTPTSSFAYQLDFGAVADPITATTASTIPTTTSSGRPLITLSTIALIIFARLRM